MSVCREGGEWKVLKGLGSEYYRLSMGTRCGSPSQSVSLD